MLKDELPKIVTGSVPGPECKKVLERRKNAIPSAIGNNYPCVIKRGAGAVFEDLDGNIFLDWVGGVG
ncbi:MAG TPA: 4-aminobutyrate--2-oxoglutarate transaminase, partial [Treponema sp.]|nr:4-aminobutyrate--2-oxoglutarate transaminase [Treponema sp.]